jgi:PhzF family phenazine biosynthesis protein
MVAMELALYQIDAFTDSPFSGNPAAICPLVSWLPDEAMQSIAAENNLSETAFFVPTKTGYHIRWFTPVAEVKLCGHATLASAYVLFELLHQAKDSITFDSLSGSLTVKRKGDWFEMDFPAQPPVACEIPQAIVNAFHETPLQCLKAEDYVVVFADEQFVAECKPNMEALKALDMRGVAITAQSSQYDFVTRFFAPKYGINEDPVTGSAFTQLLPYWAEELNKESLAAKQVSQRGGEVLGRLDGDRVFISGKAVRFMQGTIHF